MPKKSPADDAVRLKAQQMREAQARSERRTRTIIIAVVVVVVLAVVAGVTGIILSQQSRQKALSEQQSQTAAGILGTYADGAPIVYSHDGIGKPDASLPTVTLYFDYTCHACANLEVASGADIVKGATDGEYNLDFQPVTTVGMQWQKPATTASIIVAQKAPDQWTAFHQAMFQYFYEQYNASNGTVIQDLAKSFDQVKAIATQVGVPQDVVSTFTENSVDAYLQTSTTAWGKADVQGRQVDAKTGQVSLGTPEVVAEGKAVSFTDFQPTTVMAAIRATLGGGAQS